MSVLSPVIVRTLRKVASGLHRRRSLMAEMLSSGLAQPCSVAIPNRVEHIVCGAAMMSVKMTHAPHPSPAPPLRPTLVVLHPVFVDSTAEPP